MEIDPRSPHRGGSVASTSHDGCGKQGRTGPVDQGLERRSDPVLTSRRGSEAGGPPALGAGLCVLGWLYLVTLVLKALWALTVSLLLGTAMVLGLASLLTLLLGRDGSQQEEED